jgi:hypothetical protein
MVEIHLRRKLALLFGECLQHEAGSDQVVLLLQKMIIKTTASFAGERCENPAGPFKPFPCAESAKGARGDADNHTCRQGEAKLVTRIPLLKPDLSWCNAAHAAHTAAIHPGGGWTAAEELAQGSVELPSAEMPPASAPCP